MIIRERRGVVMIGKICLCVCVMMIVLSISILVDQFGGCI